MVQHMNMLKTFGRRVGRRGVFLLFFGFIHINTGIAWYNEAIPNKRNYTVLLRLLDYQSWGITFMVVGIVMLFASLIKSLEDIAFGLSAFISAILAVAISATYFPGVVGPGEGAPRAIVTYVLYTAFILIVSGWPEASYGLRKDELLRELKEKVRDD